MLDSARLPAGVMYNLSSGQMESEGAMSNIYKEILQLAERGIPVLLETTAAGKKGTGLTKRIVPAEPEAEKDAELCKKVEIRHFEDRTVYSEPVFPAERLIVLGGGHIAMPVCEFAAKIGFSVTVCDDRPEFANSGRFPLASRVICDSFPDAIRKLGITAYDYVVVLTRGHRYDADCLREILPGIFPAYLGLIGSRRRVRGLFDMLCEEGYSRKDLEHICTPVGLDIGAVTPGEIAVSILAEIVAYKRKPELQKRVLRLHTDSDLELEMIRYLAGSSEPEAIVTVVETKGSTPREAGAKMAVNRLGRVTGSIGGGCSESTAIREAVRLIGTGTYKILDIDLTGDIAESDGMVCGGSMRVLIEDAGREAEKQEGSGK